MMREGRYQEDGWNVLVVCGTNMDGPPGGLKQWLSISYSIAHVRSRGLCVSHGCSVALLHCLCGRAILYFGRIPLRSTDTRTVNVKKVLAGCFMCQRVALLCSTDPWKPAQTSDRAGTFHCRP